MKIVKAFHFEALLEAKHFTSSVKEDKTPVIVTMRKALASLPMRKSRKSTGFTGKLRAWKRVISTKEAPP